MEMFMNILIEPFSHIPGGNDNINDVTLFKLREMYGALIERIVTALPNSLIISLYEILAEKLSGVKEKINFRDHPVYKLIHQNLNAGHEGSGKGGNSGKNDGSDPKAVGLRN